MAFRQAAQGFDALSGGANSAVANCGVPLLVSSSIESL
jgi:hypothetical protein